MVRIWGSIDCDGAIELSYELSCIVQNSDNMKILYDVSGLENVTEGAKGIIGTIFIQNQPYVSKEGFIAESDGQKRMFENVVTLTGKEFSSFSNLGSAKQWLQDH